LKRDDLGSKIIQDVVKEPDFPLSRDIKDLHCYKEIIKKKIQIEYLDLKK